MKKEQPQGEYQGLVCRLKRGIVAAKMNPDRKTNWGQAHQPKCQSPHEPHGDNRWMSGAAEQSAKTSRFSKKCVNKKNDKK